MSCDYRISDKCSAQKARKSSLKFNKPIMSENTGLLQYTRYYKGEKQCPESCPHPNI